MGSFRDPELVDGALRYSLEGPMRPMELVAIPGSVMSYRKHEDLVFDWVLEHYDDITSRLPPEFGAFLPFIASGCSRERLNKAGHFFAMPEHNVPGTDEQLAKVSDQVNDCADLRDREGPVVVEYLREFAAANTE